MSGEVEAPDVVGIVAGVRTWRVANTMWARMGGWLWSWGALACWRPPDIEEWKVAQCDLGHEEPPQGCSCGIYAFNAPKDMYKEFPRVPRRVDGTEQVTGVIGGKGVIWTCPSDGPGVGNGFRAQKAKVLALFEAESTEERPMDQIAAQYKVPIIGVDDYDAFCIEHNLKRLDWLGLL